MDGPGARTALADFITGKNVCELHRAPALLLSFQQQCVHTHRHQHCLTCVLSALITEFEEQN